MCKRKKEQESPVRDSMLVGQVKQYRLALATWQASIRRNSAIATSEVSKAVTIDRKLYG